MLRFSCFLTGDEYQILKGDTPQSKKKVKSLASVLFIPVIMWILIGFMMVDVVLEGKQSIAFIVAGILGFIIFIIERNIIMAPNTKSIKCMRYILGTIIALLGAVCVDEVVFKHDIEQKMFELRETELKNIKQSIANSKDEHLLQLQENVQSKYTAWIASVEDAKKEADGSGGSGIRGIHDIARLKLNVAAERKQDYEAAQVKLAAYENSMKSEQQSAIAKAEKNMNDEVLLERIKALFMLVFSDWAMGIIYLLFTGLLFIMEFLVVFLKGAFPETNYERKLQAIEEIGKNRLQKVLNNNHKNFEPARLYPEYHQAKEILSSTSSSIYN